MVDDLKEAFQQAENDPHVKAVILSVDSPGGEVTAGDTIHHALQRLNSKKPVIVFLNSIGTSAASTSPARDPGFSATKPPSRAASA